MDETYGIEVTIVWNIAWKQGGFAGEAAAGFARNV